MVLDLLLIGLAITLEPFPLTAFILVLSAEKGIWKGLAFILGWLACLVVVIASVIAATQNNPPKPNTAPSEAALAVKLAIGVVLIAIALRKTRQRGRPRKPAAWMAKLDRLSLLSVAGLAAFLQPWTLARAHARSGDRIAIASYLGNSDVFERAITKFAAAYADQNERDHQGLVDAVKSGRITAEPGV